jgi:UDP-2-acetamido-3-amino-2,3-dideoxy-glucuronate N-acetyltransferase
VTAPFIHPQALCESVAIGAGTRVWAFAHILPGARIGADCNICDGVFIENDVLVGDRVTVKCGVQLWDGIEIEDDVFIGPNATFTNDKFPRSRQPPPAFSRTLVRRGASIGANATILPGLEIGAGAAVGAGAVVTRTVPANAIVVGNPARIAGYVGAKRQAGAVEVAELPERGGDPARLDLGLGGPSVHRMRLVRDLRGSLTAGEFAQDLPFVPQRYFMVYDVPTQEVRGEHAHRACHQFLICVRGSVVVLLDNGRERREITLDRVDVGLHIPPLIWGTQYRYTADAVLFVLASHPYDPRDYIRTYDEFRALCGTPTNS